MSVLVCNVVVNELLCRAFTGRYWNVKDDGTYTCVVCGEELFKFSSFLYSYHHNLFYVQE